MMKVDIKSYSNPGPTRARDMFGFFNLNSIDFWFIHNLTIFTLTEMSHDTFFIKHVSANNKVNHFFFESSSLLEQEQNKCPMFNGHLCKIVKCIFKFFFSILFFIFCLDLRLFEQHRKVSGKPAVGANTFRKPFLSEFKTFDSERVKTQSSATISS